MRGRFVILGATGDLAARYLVPAIATLIEKEAFPIAGPILGVGRQDWTTPQFQRHIADRLEKHAADTSMAARQETCKRLEYCPSDVTDTNDLTKVFRRSSEPVVLYLALPPKVAAKVIRALTQIELAEGSRIVCEKPFGHDAASAHELNELLRRSFPERHVYRIDHFLAKQEVQNVLGLRFANRFFEYLWNRDHIDHVEITWDETLALEGRAGYYDSAGALRDMIQNHLLQLLSLVAMEPPISFSESGFRDRKVDVFKAVRKPSKVEVRADTIRARYTAGQAGGRDVPSYAEEPGVHAEKQTETFAQVRLWIDNWRWIGVPFDLRTGKALRRNRHEIVVHFRPVPHLPFQRAAPAPNILRLRFDANCIELGLNINGPGEPFDLERVNLDESLAPQLVPEYSRLLLDVLEGDTTFSIRGDEAEESWNIVEPILSEWSEGSVPLLEYQAGSDGPPTLVQGPECRPK